jgi:hypothetical protein
MPPLNIPYQGPLSGTSIRDYYNSSNNRGPQKKLCAESTLLISVGNVGIPESARQVTANIRDICTVHMMKL